MSDNKPKVEPMSDAELDAIRAHLKSLAPHVAERQTATMLTRSYDEIRRLREVLRVENIRAVSDMQASDFAAKRIAKLPVQSKEPSLQAAFDAVVRCSANSVDKFQTADIIHHIGCAGSWYEKRNIPGAFRNMAERYNLSQAVIDEVKWDE